MIAGKVMSMEGQRAKWKNLLLDGRVKVPAAAVLLRLVHDEVIINR